MAFGVLSQGFQGPHLASRMKKKSLEAPLDRGGSKCGRPHAHSNHPSHLHPDGGY